MHATQQKFVVRIAVLTGLPLFPEGYSIFMHFSSVFFHASVVPSLNDSGDINEENEFQVHDQVR